MLNHTYTSVKNANVVDCGRKQHIPSTPSPLLRDNYLGEFRTELDKKKVLANLGIATDLSLEWEYIKGDIGRSEALMQELDSRTKYISKIDSFTKTIIEGVQYLETIVGGEQDAEAVQDERLEQLEKSSEELLTSLSDLQTYLKDTIEVNISDISDKLDSITDKVNNITELIKVSTKEGNALVLLTTDDVEEGVTPGLYVPDLSKEVNTATENIEKLQEEIGTINDSLEDFVTKEELGGGDFDFVNQSDFDNYVSSNDTKISEIEKDLSNTVKTGEDGHVDTLYVNTISKDNDSGNIKITDSFEVESGIPLDIRFVVKTIDALHALKPEVCYPGMGVIVSDQASLYILREPEDGKITQEYIEDKEGINWKCPEDLVIEVLTQEEYDKKEKEGSINPHMFYYIHEEVVEEPVREKFNSEEEYLEALNKWLRVLQQKYMSAVWGQEIEKLVASKASNTAIKSLESEITRISLLIESLSGGSQGINLKDLNTQVEQNTTNLEILTKEDGTIPTLQKDLSNLQNSVTNDYVTKESITTEDPNVEYIFLKKSAFDSYKTEHDNALQQQVTTAKVVIGDNSLTSQDSDLLLNDKKIALDEQVPVIELVDYAVFKDKPEEELEEEVYYYVYNDEERHVLYSEFSTYQTQQNNTIRTLSTSVNNNKLAIGTLENLSTDNKNSLVYAVNELHTYISRISDDLDTLITGEGIISSMQTAISELETEIASKYVTIESISTDNPDVAYIFLKKSAFENYNTTKDALLQQEVKTNQVTTTKVVMDNVTITSNDSDLLLNNEKVALHSDVPIIEFVDNETFETTQKDDNVYYYVYDDTDRYVLESEFSQYKTSQNQTTTVLSESIIKNQTSIGELNNLTTENTNTLVLAINELVQKISDLTNEVNTLKERINSLGTV